MAGRGRFDPTEILRAEIGDTTLGVDFALKGEPEAGEATFAGAVSGLVFSDTVVGRVFKAGFAGVTGLDFCNPALSVAPEEDLIDEAVFGFSEYIGPDVRSGCLIETDSFSFSDWAGEEVLMETLVGVGSLGISGSVAGGFDRLIEAALTAADFGRGCIGVLVIGKFDDGCSSVFADCDDEMRFSGVVLAVLGAALDWGLRRLGPFARLLVMCVN